MHRIVPPEKVFLVLPDCCQQKMRFSFSKSGLRMRLCVLALQDAYMPKDATKQSHRGIGFVTFSSADSVEAVMSAPHSMNGQELAIDRATPKDKVCYLPAVQSFPVAALPARLDRAVVSRDASRQDANISNCKHRGPRMSNGCYLRYYVADIVADTWGFPSRLAPCS